MQAAHSHTHTHSRTQSHAHTEHTQSPYTWQSHTHVHTCRLTQTTQDTGHKDQYTVSVRSTNRVQETETKYGKILYLRQCLLWTRSVAPIFPLKLWERAVFNCVSFFLRLFSTLFTANCPPLPDSGSKDGIQGDTSLFTARVTIPASRGILTRRWRGSVSAVV